MDVNIRPEDMTLEDFACLADFSHEAHSPEKKE
jgi:hypothetical protein